MLANFGMRQDLIDSTIAGLAGESMENIAQTMTLLRQMGQPHGAGPSTTHRTDPVTQPPDAPPLDTEEAATEPPSTQVFSSTHVRSFILNVIKFTFIIHIIRLNFCVCL